MNTYPKPLDEYPSSRELRDAAIQAVTTLERAACVRQLRVEQEESWRAIAATCHEEWGGGWEPASHQIVGIQLCRAAAEFFGEDSMAEPWN